MTVERVSLPQATKILARMSKELERINDTSIELSEIFRMFRELADETVDFDSSMLDATCYAIDVGLGKTRDKIAVIKELRTRFSNERYNPLRSQHHMGLGQAKTLAEGSTYYLVASEQSAAHTVSTLTSLFPDIRVTFRKVEKDEPIDLERVLYLMA